MTLFSRQLTASLNATSKLASVTVPSFRPIFIAVISNVFPSSSPARLAGE
ncbi:MULTISPECIES: hypothetical protein [unclassified Arsenophonus]|nr:hypothetical protein [Arsenophonus sp.]MDR5615463.1 hypothetical protein [Arsenophonus sp.]